MKFVFMLMAIVISATMPLAFAEDQDAVKRQLDQACEVARLEKLRPIREKFAAECVADWDRSQEYCDRFYSDYGNQGGDQAVLFYDLPQCEKAWNYRQSYRSTD